MIPYRILHTIIIVGCISASLTAQSILNGTVSFLNSGSRPAIGVKISAPGAADFYTTSSGMFSLVFPNKKPGDKVRIMVGPTDHDGTLLDLVNDKVLSEVRVPSRPDDDIIEIIVCPIEKRDEAVARYNGILVKTINEKAEKQIKEINEKISKVAGDREIMLSLQDEKDKLAAERDSALDKAEEQAFFIASINLDKANQLVKDAVVKIDSLKDIDGAIAILDNEMLLNLYKVENKKAIKAKKEIDKIIEGYVLKIKLLKSALNIAEVNKSCMALESICKEQDIDISSLVNCFELAMLIQHKKSDLYLESPNIDPTAPKNSFAAVTFVIEDFDTHKEIIGTLVSVRQVALTLPTLAGGKVRFDNVPVGEIEYYIMKEGYRFETGRVKVSTDVKTNVFRVALSKLDDKKILVTGEITDSEGRDVKDAWVEIKIGDQVRTVLTDASGNYSADITLSVKYPSSIMRIELKKGDCKKSETVDIPRNNVVYKDFKLDCETQGRPTASPNRLPPFAYKVISEIAISIDKVEQKGTQMTVYLTVENQSQDVRKFWLDSKTHILFDQYGNEYKSTYAQIGSKSDQYIFLIPGLEYKGLLKFDVGSEKITTIAKLSIFFTDGFIFRNIKI